MKMGCFKVLILVAFWIAWSVTEARFGGADVHHFDLSQARSPDLLYRPDGNLYGTTTRADLMETGHFRVTLGGDDDAGFRSGHPAATGSVPKTGIDTSARGWPDRKPRRQFAPSVTRKLSVFQLGPQRASCRNRFIRPFTRDPVTSP